ncbi:MAG: flippase-like domain-containing protein, partial [Oscillospiraceae bacterium]|nr:flippase-like domain-containing protein [Oscillospiraceae bacterium]
SKGFSPKSFSRYLESNNPWWLMAALLSMLFYVGSNAWMIGVLLKGFGFGRNYFNCLSYTASDLYFSAITPSSTGGQPMEAWFMFQDGVPVVISTVVLLTYLLLYTLSTVLIGLTGMLLVPSSILSFGTFGRILIGVGGAIQVGLTLLYGMLLWNKKLLLKICDWVLRTLGKLHLLRNLEQKRKKLFQTMVQYSEAALMLGGKRKLLRKALLLNLAHRAAQIMVTVFCFLAGGEPLRLAPKMFAMQGCVVIGASCIPIPGAMGVTDYLMIDGFSSMMTEAESANLELLSRAMSFYICILLCGILVLLKLALVRLRRAKKQQP